MKVYIFIGFVFLLILNTNGILLSQAAEISYKGNGVEEYVWSISKNEFIFVEKLPITTKIVLTESHIYFKKGYSNWLKNTWRFSKKEIFDNQKEYSVYFDEKNQKILLSHSENEILYYYNWNTHTNEFSNVAIYKNLKEDQTVIDELFSPQKATYAQSLYKVNTGFQGELPIKEEMGMYISVYHKSGSSSMEDARIAVILDLKGSQTNWRKYGDYMDGALSDVELQESEFPYKYQYFAYWHSKGNFSGAVPAVKPMLLRITEDQQSIILSLYINENEPPIVLYIATRVYSGTMN